MMLLLVVTCIAGLAILHSRFTGDANRNGGIGRYEHRDDNTQAWKEFDGYKSPSAEYLRGYVCAGSKSVSMCTHSVLPTDNLRHVLISMRNHDGDGEPTTGSPVGIFAGVIYQETGLKLKERLDDQSTLKDVLTIWNELAAAQNSANSTPHQFSKEDSTAYQAYLEKHRLDSVNRALFGNKDQ